MLDDLGGGGVLKKSVRRSAAERAAIVAESYEPGATVLGVALRHGIVASQLSTWRMAAKRDTNPIEGPAFTDLTVMPEAFLKVLTGSIPVYGLHFRFNSDFDIYRTPFR